MSRDVEIGGRESAADLYERPFYSWTRQQADLLRSGHLQPAREEISLKAYSLARKDAARETGLPLSVFPEVPSFSLAECESADVGPQTASNEPTPEQNDEPLGKGDKRA